MKKLVFALVIATISWSITSCTESKTDVTQMKVKDEDLPNELRGIKFYRVYTENGASFVLATTPTQTAVTKYKANGIVDSRTVGILESDSLSNKQRLIEIKEIISENDSVIVCKIK